MPFRAQVVMPTFSLLPSDVFTNTFHFESLTLDTAAMAAEWTPRLTAFYNAVYAGSRGIANYMGPNASFEVNWYDLSDPPPRVPLVQSLAFAPGTRNLTSVPTEVAVVLSFQGAPVSGQVQARRRGRVYLGALTPGFMTSSAGSAFPTIDGSVTSAIADAARINLATPGDNESWWAVWSPTGSTSTRVTNGWVDNSPDTQRRRSVNATGRFTWQV